MRLKQGLKAVSADAFLVQWCNRDDCEARTVHGPISRLRWVWADEGNRLVRPEVGCRACGMPCGDVFELVPVDCGE